MPTKRPRRWLLWLLEAAVGAALARFFMPPDVRRLLIVIGIPAFLIWLWWDSRRDNRDLADHLDRLETRKKEYRRAKQSAAASAHRPPALPTTNRPLLQRPEIEDQ